MENPDIWTQLLFSLFSGLEYIGPVIIGIIVVPLFDIIKKTTKIVGNWPAFVQQIMVAAVSGLLTWLGTLLNVVLPADLSLFGQPELSALLSAALALGIHAGKKAKTDG